MVAIFLGGAMGSVFRAILSNIIPALNLGFPVSTLLINWTGSAGIAFAYLYFHKKGNGFWRPFWMTGFFGGFTTMSLFSYESLVLILTEHWIQFAIYMLLTLLGSTGIVKVILQRGGNKA